MFPSPYQIKKAIMLPWKLFMRRKENLEPGFIRSALELHYYRPTFYRWLEGISANQQLLHEANLTSNSLVLDVGAYTGEWAQELIELTNPNVIAFEPDPLNFRQLQKRAESFPGLTAYDYGLGDRTEDVKISQEYLGSSIYNAANPPPDITVADAKIVDILEAWGALSLDQVDLMKVNIEGGEFPLFERMIETDLLPKVACFLIQFHEWHPGAYHRRRKIRRALAKTHKLVWDYPFIWEKWERIQSTPIRT